MSYRILKVTDLGDAWGLSIHNNEKGGNIWDYFFLKEHHPQNPEGYTFATMPGFPGNVDQLWLDCTFVYHNLS